MSVFPLDGVIGIVASHTDELDQAQERQLRSIEVRADLLLDVGYSVEDVLDLVGKARAGGFRCLFTLRHPEHGGKFGGSEEDRVDLNQRALKAGADIIDLEWGCNATQTMVKKGAPLVVSYHNFDGMPETDELDTLTRDMEAMRPDAIKVVPTASTLSHSARMLKWVSEAVEGIRRIGFAMGLKGACSRTLTMAFGSPITYASFGKPVAPGQLSIDTLLDRYRVSELNPKTRYFAVAGSGADSSPVLEGMNRQFQDGEVDALCIPLVTSDLDELLPALEDLRIEGVQLEGPMARAAAERFSSENAVTSDSAYLDVPAQGSLRLLPDGRQVWLQAK